jgi:hypothetical protein
MKRLKLDVDELLVESFNSTDAPTSQRGTVRAHGQAGQATYACTAGWYTCDTQESCDGTCVEGGTCGYFSQCVGWCASQHDGCSDLGSCTGTISCDTYNCSTNC